MENGIFSCLVQERKTRGKENGVENNPSGPTKYCLPNLGEREKMIWVVNYTNTFTFIAVAELGF